MARLLSLTLDHTGDWLNTPPIKALGLHLRSPEFVLALKYRLGMPVFDSAGPCPACLRESDVLGDHAMCCGAGGERISRHNSLRDAVYETVAAGLGPVREGRFLLPGTDRRPADVLVPNWAGGKDAAMDVKVPSRSPRCQELPIRLASLWTTPTRGSLMGLRRRAGGRAWPSCRSWPRPLGAGTPLPRGR